MSITGTNLMTQVGGLLPMVARWSTAERIAAINQAIYDSFPEVSDVDVDASITLASTTYEYSPAATDVTEQGFAVAYVAQLNAPKSLLYRIGQRQDGAAWTILVPSDIALSYHGRTLHLQYRKRVAPITAIADSIDLPTGYLTMATMYWLALNAVTGSNGQDTKPYEVIMTQMQPLMQQAKMKAARGQLPAMIAKVSGASSADVNVNKYGPWVQR